MAFGSSTIPGEFNPKFPFFQNVDAFIPRTNILKHITQSLPHFSGILLDVGCGYMPYRDFIKKESSIKQYLGLDLADATTYKSVKPDIEWDGYNIPLPDNSVQSVLLTEVLEHCPYPEKVLSEVHRVLSPQGKIIFTVPFVWYLHESPFDFYRYTPYAMQKMFSDCNLTIEQMYTYGTGSHAFLHSYFIWLKRSSIPKFLRFAVYLASLPLTILALKLKKRDIVNEFRNGLMFTGICGIAHKE